MPERYTRKRGSRYPKESLHDQYGAIFLIYGLTILKVAD